MRHHSFMRWASATMAALMFFQCTAPVAFAADDAILAESSIAVSSADSESVPADSDAGYIPEQSPENTSVDSSSMNEASSEPLTGDSSASSDLPEDVFAVLLCRGLPGLMCAAAHSGLYHRSPHQIAAAVVSAHCGYPGCGGPVCELAYRSSRGYTAPAWLSSGRFPVEYP